MHRSMPATPAMPDRIVLQRLLRLDQLCLGDYAAGLGLAELEGNT